VDKNTSKSKYVSVSLTEEGVLNYSAVVPELNGWRYYRVEYGGPNTDCFMERQLWLPQMADSYIFDLLFDFWQAKTHNQRKKLQRKIIQELERSLIKLLGV
jgi:hypothetical protein